ncbi:MAG: hydrogenase formation protein HypD [Candidatus Aminicenantes bacterium]|uniref:[NiFe] hydrogenase metallocenter assembly protein HypD n=1 Tax=Candidatus Saccharicenans subterraneus TaxID=2508984 RepID=A0A3E2BLM8_9BACT|nr:hydrogenase formation protein HypD [Candidatus Aminicenantes bacterium]RFT15547.1 MAG: [NiFe] hydrogenase metallocenter assembly protein HypD [Candidatus Saccharicenans subterraneum]
MARRKPSRELLSGWRSAPTIRNLLKAISIETGTIGRPLRIMEVCGTHTMTLHRSGLKPLLREAGVVMVSGPGCPVCITPDYYHEAIIDLVTSRKNILVATFGDMTRVPTARGSLQTTVPAPGSEIRIVYSPEEALELAVKNLEKEVIFFGAGFETTIPAIAFTVKRAAAENLKNFSLLAALWLIPPALQAILESGEVAIDGFIYPGHVSVIIGQQAYRFVAEKFGVPGAIAGFEPADVLLGILSVARQIRLGRPEVANEYRRVVQAEGNPRALALMEEMLEPYEADWRGLGRIKISGLRLRPRFQELDAVRKFDLHLQPAKPLKLGCRCGEVLKGLIEPVDCPLFGRSCDPDHPRGPCMVSYEGACLIEYKYSSGGRKQ